MMVTTLRCTNCGTLNEEGVEWCKACDTFLPWTGAVADSRPQARLALAVPDTGFAVAPGAEASVNLTIRNIGRSVDRVDLDVVGDGATWAVIEPGTVSLMPDDKVTAKLMIRPPRDATVGAGRHVLTVRAASGIDAGVVEEQNVTVDVGHFDALRVRMTPLTSRGRTEGVHRVVVENGGNRAASVSLDSRDPEGGQLGVTFEPAVVNLERGASAAVTVTVRPAEPIFDGAARPRPFQVVATGAEGSECTVDGVMVQELMPEAPLTPAPEPIVALPTPEPAAPPRRRRWWPLVVAAVALLGGLAGTAAVVESEVDGGIAGLFSGDDDGGQVAGAVDDVVDGAAGQQGGDGGDGAAVAEPADLSVEALQCALVPAAGELRFAVQVANSGGPAAGVVVGAVADGLQGATQVDVDGLATAVFGVPVDERVLGSEVDFTVVVDPGEGVEEADEGNNTRDVTITFPDAAQQVSLCD
jgi:hypothetical protein